MVDLWSTIANYHQPPYDKCCPTNHFGHTTSGRPKSVWLHHVFGDHGRRWSLVVGDDFGRRWSPTNRILSVTGPLTGCTVKTSRMKIVIYHPPKISNKRPSRIHALILSHFTHWYNHATQLIVIYRTLSTDTYSYMKPLIQPHIMQNGITIYHTQWCSHISICICSIYDEYDV